jgi:integrase
MLVYNPAEGIELPKATMREQLFMTPVQVATLASEVPDHLAAFVLVLGVAGLRFGEAAALNRSDVDVVGRRIRVCRSVTEVYTLARGVELVFGETKARRSRSVAIPPHLAATLNDYIMRDEILDPKALIFTASNGAILRAPNFLSQVLRPALRRAGLNPRIRTHDLRHSAAAAMIAVNPNPELIKRQLGHSSIRVTFDVYGHLFPDESDKMADALETLWNADQTRTRPVALVATLDP